MRNILGIFFTFLTASGIFAQQNKSAKVYEVWDDQPAKNRGADYSIIQARGYPYDADWEKESYPIGNGYMGANIFGRTDTERIQITEKTLANEGLYEIGGLTNFAEIYLDFDHHNPKNYKRSLNLNNGILNVTYIHDGVKYTREYIANYPDNIIVVKLSANKKRKISFALKAEIPYLRSVSEKNTRTGKIFAKNDLITLSGNIPHFNVNYEGQIKVINDGGKLYTQNNNRNPEIRVVDANSVVILIAAGTNYRLNEKIFTEKTFSKKLDVDFFPSELVSNRINKAILKGYNALKETHLKDYQNLFSRVTVNLASKASSIPTRELLDQYKLDPSNPYLEELIFQFGRYLLISSSRKGTLPAGLQGVWSQYAVTPWTGGFWHNINVQMNYWGAFSTNLCETFTPYLEYYKAYRPYAEMLATEFIKNNNPKALDENGDNGWSIGTGATAYTIGKPGGHSGPGTGGFTTKLLWDRYDFTRDTIYLQNIGYPALFSMGKFLSKTLKAATDGTLLVEPSASPEIRIIDQDGKFLGPHYVTKGSTFDQGFVWETYNDILKAANVLGANEPFLNVLKDQIKKLDPILIGQTGQVKEFREENGYGEIGDPNHRHVSHLCPLYPGTLINSNTPEWLEGVRVALNLRENICGGWALAHRMNLRARTKEADKALEAFTQILQLNTLPNLWTVYPPLQIDANLGLVAGVAEMLIQSHEGYIELLPTLPDKWKTGSFKGLVARGNFVIDTSWELKELTSIRIHSRSGGKCSIKFNNLKNIQITDAAGVTLPFTKDSNGIVSFETKKMNVYSITPKN